MFCLVAIETFDLNVTMTSLNTRDGEVAVVVVSTAAIVGVSLTVAPIVGGWLVVASVTVVGVVVGFGKLRGIYMQQP